MRFLTALSVLLFVVFASAQNDSIKQACSTHFASPTQSSGKTACVFGATQLQKDGREKAITACKERHVFARRDDLSCRVGIGLAEELARSPELDKKKLTTCQELYPVVTALDAYFQEACLAGAYAIGTYTKADVSLCQGLSNDRSFVGPCASGLSATLTGEDTKGSFAEQNKLCLQYFDKTQFHTGYRACLNSRALLLISENNKTSVIKQCDLFTSNNKSETERAACIVGASISKSIADGKTLPTRFQTCGDGKVSYQDRDYLACLTAASLLDFMDKSKARGACKTVFDSRKNKSRGQCANYLEKF